ncbi:GlxA family transcriptional regulator [Neptuniibacter halophilus]|uniref:GlxA family transcriptional regulator n=1 Tax=Neptuniibacter halophilus TaxID=651666 RepID=UPI002572BCB2|nr:GlxA family transcriptional regulator [Neptuniibacter halophilus]
MKQIAVLAYPDCQILDVTGPLQVFASANTLLGKQAYQIRILAPDNQPVRTNSGMQLVPDLAYPDAQALDTLLLAGGRGVAAQCKDPQLIQWIRQQASQVRRLGSVCSGAFLLAESGLLKGRQVVSHWRCCDLLAREYPDMQVQPDAIWIKQDNLYTSAGVTSGIDLALALLEEDFGHSVAMEVARELVVFMKRPGGQAQYSSQLQAQEKASGVVAKAIAFIERNLGDDLSLPTLAEHCCVSERHLFRLFKNSFNHSPAAYIENSRLALAQQLVAAGDMGLEQVAQRCGFVSADNLRRVFVRRLGVNPSEYKLRFGSHFKE